ncbi:unnamed protein product [Lampetra planeri]
MSKSAAKHKNLPIVESDDEDRLEVVPTTPPESGALEMRPVELLQPMQEGAAGPDRPPSPENWRTITGQLSQLLEPAAHLVVWVSTAGIQPHNAIAELERQRPAISSGATQKSSAIFSSNMTQKTGAIFSSDVTQQPGAIFSSEAMQQLAAIFSAAQPPPIARFGALVPVYSTNHFQIRCLPPVRPFTASGGDWTSFWHHFEAAYISVGWSSEEALRSLLMAFDDDSLAVLNAIPAMDQATLPQACAQMAAIFDPPSNAHRRFLLRRRGEAETHLAFCSALLALGQAAYPNMDTAALDSLALK